MSGSGPFRRAGLGLLAFLTVGLGAGIVWRLLPSHPSTTPDAFPLPPYSDSHFLNVTANATYIGSAGCAACHPQNHKSYSLTPHSRALREVDPTLEPQDVSVRHAPSGRIYRLYQKDGKLRQEESIQADGKVMARVDLSVRYAIGSGHFSRSFLTEADGFLYESPITWYATTQKWDMTPGYNTPRHWGSERPIKVTCLVCHAGRVEETAGAMHKLTVHEAAIGCENCHGPGSLHAARRRVQPPPQDEDRTIVHPGKLSRTLVDAVCAECHQSSAASVFLRGRKAGDFRPGRPLTDYRASYQFSGRSDRMTVVGHVDQLRQSPCYQRSDSLACVTCHDPHRAEPLTDKAAYYRKKCLACHAQAGCKLGLEERTNKQMDNCVACHMPRGDTEIPHIAFTHHRIGRHMSPSPTSELESPSVPDLVAIDENQSLSPLDRERNLGLAYVDAYRKPSNARNLMILWERARTHLEAVYKAGLRDGETSAALAEIYWRGRDKETDAAFLESAAKYASEAVAAADTAPDSRVLALAILAEHDRKKGDFAMAVARMEEAVRIRRSADLWQRLGVSYMNNNQIDRAIVAFDKSLSIREFQHSARLGLAEAYRLNGDAARASDQLRQAKWLQENGQDW